jgi:hypothetical protein
LAAFQVTLIGRIWVITEGSAPPSFIFGWAQLAGLSALRDERATQLFKDWPGSEPCRFLLRDALRATELGVEEITARLM